MKEFQFTIYLNGMGDTPEEAWEDAVENYITEYPGPMPEAEDINDMGEIDEEV